MVERLGRGKRRRGVRLSSQGWERLQTAEAQQAAEDNDRQPYTLEALAQITGLSINTLTKVRSGKAPVDRQTIADYFEAFGLVLAPEDYVHPEAVADDGPLFSPKGCDLNRTGRLGRGPRCLHISWSD